MGNERPIELNGDHTYTCSACSWVVSRSSWFRDHSDRQCMLPGGCAEAQARNGRGGQLSGASSSSSEGVAPRGTPVKRSRPSSPHQASSAAQPVVSTSALHGPLQGNDSLQPAREHPSRSPFSFPPAHCRQPSRSALTFPATIGATTAGILPSPFHQDAGVAGKCLDV